MELMHAFVLAIVQGITEFFPVSSSAHLILIPELLGWPDQGQDFDLGVHVGSLVAVMIWYRSEVVAILSQLKDVISTPKSLGTNLAGQLMIATIPVLLVGFLFKDFIELYTRNPIVIASATAIFGVVLWLSAQKKGVKTLDNMTALDALIIGLAQCIALIPGTSRSGITMSAASYRGYDIETAARFSFLLAIPTIGIAGLYLAFKLVRDGTPVGWQWVVIGAILSGIAAYIGIGFCLATLKRLGYTPFVIYRLLLAGFIFMIFL